MVVSDDLDNEENLPENEENFDTTCNTLNNSTENKSENEEEKIVSDTYDNENSEIENSDTNLEKIKNEYDFSLDKNQYCLFNSVKNNDELEEEKEEKFEIDDIDEIKSEITEFIEEIPEEVREKSETEVINEVENIDDTKNINLIENINTEEKIEVKEEKGKETDEIEKKEPQKLELIYDKSMGNFETALEIRYSSLKLSKFPIKISNLPKDIVFTDELTIGNSSIKIGDEVINNCYMKISSNDSIKLFEIKHREFKLGISVTLEDDTIKSYGNIHYYEISSLIKYSRLQKVLKLIENIFDGKPITFKVNKLYGNIILDDTIEVIRIKTILNLFETLDNAKYKVQLDKISDTENIYYLLNLEAVLKRDETIETWCNFNLKNVSAYEGDFITLKRIHKFDNKSSIEETIVINDSLDKNNILPDSSIKGYRKRCTIHLKKTNN